MVLVKRLKVRLMCTVCRMPEGRQCPAASSAKSGTTKVFLNPKDFTHVIYVAAHDFGSFEGKDPVLKYFLGIVDTKHNYSTSIGSSSGLSFFRQPKISRAYYKLHELDKRGLVDFCGETGSS